MVNSPRMKDRDLAPVKWLLVRDRDPVLRLLVAERHLLTNLKDPALLRKSISSPPEQAFMWKLKRVLS